MKLSARRSLRLFAFVTTALLASRAVAAETNSTQPEIDFRYAPPSWQTAICLPDDWQKTLVGKDGALLYDYPGQFAGFGTKITFGIDGAVTPAEQSQDRNTILNVLWVFRAGEAPVMEELIGGHSSKPPLAHVECGADSIGSAPRHDVLLAHLRNPSTVPMHITPTLTVESALRIAPQPDRHRVLIGNATTVFCPQPFESADTSSNKVVFKFGAFQVGPTCYRGLHLFEGFAPKWAQPGAVTRRRDVLTEFGPLSFEFRVAKDGKSSELKLTPPKRNSPSRILLRLDGWSGRSGTMELAVNKSSSQQIQLRAAASSDSIQ